MIHTARRLTPYAVNKVVHIDAVKDLALRRLIRDDRARPHIRRGLKEIDDQLELLVPRVTDGDNEMQLKRFIQWKLGTVVNLTTLRNEHFKYYKQLYEYGSPQDVIRRWGLTPTHDHIRTEEALLQAIENYKNEAGIVTGVTKDKSLYRSLIHYAGKSGKNIADYLADKGIKYES